MKLRPSCMLLILWLIACTSTAAPRISAGEEEAEMQHFRQLLDLNWQLVLNNSATEDWTENWSLDGLKAEVVQSADGMKLTAGPVARQDSCHAVLWTKQSFVGDIRIDYEYTRLDEAVHYVTILYIQATGSGAGPYAADISGWRKMRNEPSMKTYYNNMNTYHISYAAFGNDKQSAGKDYIRARRYMPLAGKGLRGTALSPDYLNTGLFSTGRPHKITVIKSGNDLYMHIRIEDREMLCHWQNDSLPPITTGRVGLRHMYTRSALYRDFQIRVLPQDYN